MSEPNTTSAMEGLRVLTLQIDGAIEGLLDAHGFCLAGMNTSAAEARAVFLGSEGQPTADWTLTVVHSSDGTTAVNLSKGTEQPAMVSLTISLGSDLAATLGEGVALALSFIQCTDHLKTHQNRSRALQT